MRRRRRDAGARGVHAEDGARETGDGAVNRELTGRRAPLPADDGAEQRDVTAAEDGTEGFVPL